MIFPLFLLRPFVSQYTPEFKATGTHGIFKNLYNDHGLRIDGVTKGKTADKYGIIKGDIIIQIGDIEVTDIMKYMEGLLVLRVNI